MAFISWALRAMGLQPCRALISTPWASLAPTFACSCPSYTELMMHFDDIAQLATHCTRHLIVDLRPRGCFVFPRETREGMCYLLALIDGALTWFWATWRPMRPIWSPQSPNRGLEMFCNIWMSSPFSSSIFRPSLLSLAHEASMLPL